MFPMRNSDVIPHIVEAMLPRFTRDQVLHLTLCAEVAQRGEDYSSHDTEIRYVHLVFYRPNNYTKVGMHIGTREDGSLLEDDHVWEVTSDHDSCWRTDGVSSRLFDLYIAMCKLVDPEARPIDLDTTLEFGCFGGIRLRELESPGSVHYVRPQGGTREWTIRFKYKKVSKSK